MDSPDVRKIDLTSVYDCTYTTGRGKVSYEWNTRKAKDNVRKHGVEFADAAVALEDEWAITITDPDSNGEQRFISLGTDPVGRLLVTVFTLRNNNVRLISSRKVTKAERKRYEAMK